MRPRIRLRVGAGAAFLVIGAAGLDGCARKRRAGHTGGTPLDSGPPGRPDSGLSDSGLSDSGRPHRDGEDTGDTGAEGALDRWSGEVMAEVWAVGDGPGAELGTRMVWADGDLWVSAPGGAGETLRLPDGQAFVGGSPSAHLGAALAPFGDGVLAGAWSRTGGDDGAVYLLSADVPGSVVEAEIPPLVTVEVGATGMVLLGQGAGTHPDGWLLGLPRTDRDRGTVELYDGATHSVMSRWTGSAAGELAGGSLAAADLNGDGLVDLVVGAWGWSAFAGAVQVSLAPFDTDATLDDADRIWAGEAWAVAGFSVAVGDIDGDGTPDVVVGAFGDTRNGSGAGALTVVPGASASGLLVDFPDHRLGSAPDAHLGSSLAVADIDRDGQADISVGAPDAAGGGVVQLHYGPLEGVSTRADARLQDPERGALAGLGTSVALHPELGWAAGAPDDSEGSGRVLFAEAIPRPPM